MKMRCLDCISVLIKDPVLFCLLLSFCSDKDFLFKNCTSFKYKSVLTGREHVCHHQRLFKRQPVKVKKRIGSNLVQKYRNLK